MTIRSIALLGLLVVLAACGSAVPPTATATPTPMLTTTPTTIPTRVPTSTSTPIPPTATPAVSATPTLPVTPIEPLLDICVRPPVRLDVPEGWRVGCDTLLYRDVDGSIATVPIALLKGDVSGAEGTIVLVWGYDSVINALPRGGLRERSIYADSLRILRTVIFDAECNIGIGQEEMYRIGNLDARGATFNVIDCPDAPDTRGWFAGVVQDDINFTFYIYADPLLPMSSPAERELQSILDTVEIDVAGNTYTQEQIDLTREALLPTVRAAATRDALSAQSTQAAGDD